MAVIRQQRLQVPDLATGVVAILLAGWGAKPPADVPDTWRGFSGGWGELMFTGEIGGGGLWRRHEWYLRAVAEQWNWQPQFVAPDGRRLFWAEAVALGLERER